MNKKLIDKWNRTVDTDDTVWVLGDYFYFYPHTSGMLPTLSGSIKDNIMSIAKGISDPQEFLCYKITKSLNGIKNLILGNHDVKGIDFYKSIGFDFVSPYPILLNNFYLLSHEPLQLSETTPYFNVYGHVHNDSKYKDTETSKCVSVERIDYRPLQLF